jgi:hypothetical protein
VTLGQAVALVRKRGVVLEAAAGPVPSLAETIAGAPIRGSWWAHPRGQKIFELTRAVRDSHDILVCRLINGKITYVHRRLWPSLVRAAARFPSKWLAQVHEVHTASGRHVTKEVAFPAWVPEEISAEASKLAEEQAVLKLGGCVPSSRGAQPNPPLQRTRQKQARR